MEDKELLKLEENPYVIVFKKPYVFEGTEYKYIDLSPLRDLSGYDMITAQNRAGIQATVLPEQNLDYLFNLAAIGTNMPVEFYRGMKLSYAQKVKNAVVGFLGGLDE